MAAVLGLVSSAGCSSTTKKKLTPTEHAQLYIDIASAALKEGDPTSALVNLKKAEEIDSSIPEIYHARGIALYQKQDVESGIASIKKALQMNGEYSDAWNSLGKMYLDLGKFKEAETALKKAASDQLYHNTYIANTNLGILYYRQGDFDQAESFMNRAILGSATHACFAYYYRGHIRLRQNKVMEAISDYEQASKKVCGGFADAHFALGLALEKDKQFDRARKKYLDVRTNFPENRVAQQAMERLKHIP